MTRPEYRQKLLTLIGEIRDRLPALTQELFKILLTKNKDYTEADGNQFQGFIDAAEGAGIDGPERVVFSRIIDKHKRISNLLTSGDPPAVSDEKIRETNLDSAGYHLIMAAMLDWIAEENKEMPPED